MAESWETMVNNGYSTACHQFKFKIHCEMPSDIGRVVHIVDLPRLIVVFQWVELSTSFTFRCGNPLVFIGKQLYEHATGYRETLGKPIMNQWKLVTN